MKIEESKRLKELPPYLFAEIDKIIKEKREQGLDVISLGIGDPDIPTPKGIIDAIQDEAENPVNHQYPSSYGMDLFREAVADFYMDRFSVKIDPASEVIPLLGAKEGIANIAYTYVDPGDYVLVPDPSYPVYSIGTMFAGGQKLMHVNYPNNPTSAICGIDFYERLAEFALKNNIIVCHDNAYSDTYFGDNSPVSFLNASGSKEVGIEFYSLSKTFNMTGWRIGCAVGNREVIASLGKYKTNVDSGVFNAVQYAAIKAFKNYREYSSENNKIYKKRREMVTGILDNIGIDYYKSNATIYVWAKVPEGHTSKSFAKLILDEANVVVTPGSAYGKFGEGYFRISLTISDDRLREALDRIDGTF